MKYTFKQMLDAEIYESTQVMFTFGKYTMFNNLIGDELKALCTEETHEEISNNEEMYDEFGLEGGEEEIEIETDGLRGLISVVDFDTYLEVSSVPSVNGKWYCRVNLEVLNKKQIEKLLNFIKEPSPHGVLVISCTDWKIYREFLKNKTLNFSSVSHIFELSFPNRKVLEVLVEQMFNDKAMEIDKSGVSAFILKMGNAYDEYIQEIVNISEKHSKQSSTLTKKEINKYMKGIAHYEVEDLILEIINGDNRVRKVNKALEILSILEYEYGAIELIYKLRKIITEEIEFRRNINKGIIPIGINYFYKDVVEELGGGKYEKMQEWSFKRKADIASLTSLRDWEYMDLILSKALINKQVSEELKEIKAKKVLYDLCMRKELSTDNLSLIFNIGELDRREQDKVDRIIYQEKGKV